MLAKNDPEPEIQERAAVSLERLKKYVLAPPTHVKVLDYEDAYEHLAGGDTKIFNPTWEDIEEAIESLNGNSHSVMILQKHRDFIAQEYMAIGGGASDGMYICFIRTKPPERFDWKLYDPSQSKEETIEIMASQLMKLSRQDCLYLDDVVKAAKTYTLSGDRDSSLHWQKTEELDKEIPWLKDKT